MSGTTDIIAFYSLRGGTGRSTALANVAYALAETGADVGCMDLDLEAPDLHRTFPNLGLVHATARTVHDYLQDEGGTLKDLDDFVIDVGERLDESPEGDLVLISGETKPPGAENPKDTVGRVLDLGTEFGDQQELDYLLLDSSSGLGNHLVPVFDMADQFLAFHRWTDRHRQGMVELAKWLDTVPTGEDLTSVASDVPEAVTESEISSWAANELEQYDFSDRYVLNHSEAVAQDPLVTSSNPDTKVTKQYQGLAEQLAERK